MNSTHSDPNQTRLSFHSLLNTGWPWTCDVCLRGGKQDGEESRLLQHTLLCCSPELQKPGQAWGPGAWPGSAETGLLPSLTAVRMLMVQPGVLRNRWPPEAQPRPWLLLRCQSLSGTESRLVVPWIVDFRFWGQGQQSWIRDDTQ